MGRLLLLVTVATSVVACGTEKPGSAILARADSLRGLDVEHEVSAALARGDRRLISVCGYACVPPGVDLADSLTGSLGDRPVEGTTDAPGPDELVLNEVATAYATRYNELLVARLRAGS